MKRNSISYSEKLLHEVYDITDVLNQEGKSGAECRYKEIVALLLTLVLDGQKIIRALLGILLGFALSFLFR